MIKDWKNNLLKNLIGLYFIVEVMEDRMLVKKMDLCNSYDLLIYAFIV